MGTSSPSPLKNYKENSRKYSVLNIRKVCVYGSVAVCVCVVKKEREYNGKVNAFVLIQ